MPRAAFRALALVLVATGMGLAAQAPENDGKREFTLTGCLLRAGYAGYQMEGVAVEAIDGKPVPAAVKEAVAALKKWTLQGGGNLGPRVGEKVQVVGRSEWQAGPAAQPDEPPRLPSLDVKSLKTVATSCT